MVAGGRDNALVGRTSGLRRPKLVSKQTCAQTERGVCLRRIRARRLALRATQRRVAKVLLEKLISAAASANWRRAPHANQLLAQRRVATAHAPATNAPLSQTSAAFAADGQVRPGRARPPLEPNKR